MAKSPGPHNPTMSNFGFKTGADGHCIFNASPRVGLRTGFRFNLAPRFCPSLIRLRTFVARRKTLKCWGNSIMMSSIRQPAVGPSQKNTVNPDAPANPPAEPLKLFSVVIPARDEAESLPATAARTAPGRGCNSCRQKFPRCARSRTPASMVLAARSCLACATSKGTRRSS